MLVANTTSMARVSPSCQRVTSLHCWLPEKKTVIALNIRENRLSPFKPDSLPKKEKVQKKKEEDWHRKLKKNAERKKLKSNALPTAKAL
jgi:hypothetical protein